MFEAFADVWIMLELVLVQYYGWVLFAWLFAWLGYQLWLDRQVDKFLSTITWVYLEVRVDELNEKSPVAMEQIFSSLHAMQQSFSLGETWQGRVPLVFSAELVSIGGRVSYFFKLPERYRNMLESAVFAQYTKAEIREVQDYLANLPQNFDPVTSEFEMWGTQLIKRANNALPLRTYRQDDSYFEHSSQKSTVEPLSGVLEALSNISPNELMAIQIVCMPQNEDWKKGGFELVTKLKGLPTKAKAPSFFETIFFTLPGTIIDGIFEALGMVPGEPKKEERPAPLIGTMSDAEKSNIDSIVSGLSKLSFNAKMRLMYLAPTDKFSKGTRIPEILGAFRNFDNPQLNGLRPDSANVTTDASFKLFQTLEQPWLDYKILVRKNKFLKAFKERSHSSGAGKTYFNTEELATLFHFPQVPNARVSQIERVQTVKSAPPIDLPTG